MTGFQTVFGGTPIAPSVPTYLALGFSVNTILGWPLESNTSVPFVADWLDCTATAASLTLQFQDARLASTGYAALFNNVGTNTFTVLDNLNNVLASPASGQAWILVLADNSTQQGTWRAVQLGTAVSTANAAALAGLGLKAITTTLNERILINAQAVPYTAVATDRASCLDWTGGAGGVFTVDPVGLGLDWFCYIKNSGTAVLTVTPASGTIDGSANKTFNPNDSCIVLSTGTNLITMGFGQSVASSFSFVAISVTPPGTGTIVLSGAQLNRVSYKFTGALTGNVTIQVPGAVQQYWVDNETSGAFTLTISTGAGSTVTVAQGTRNILYCDGVNIVNAVSTGTGSTTLVGDGSAAAPGLAWASDTQMGLYKVGTDILGISTAGTARGSISAAGNWVINAPTGGVGVTITGLATQFALRVNAPNTTGQSDGLQIVAGTNASDNPLLVQNAAGATMVAIQGGGNVVVSAPASSNAVAISGVSGSPALKLSPAAALDLAEDIVGIAAGSAVIRYSANNAGNIGVIGVSGAAGQWTPNSAAGDIVFRNTGAVRFSVDGGTTEKVVVASTGAASFGPPTSGMAVTITDGGGGILQLNSNHTAGDGIRFNDTNASPQSYDIGLGIGSGSNSLVIYDRTNTAARVSIAPSGAVTLGTPTAATALTATGAAGSFVALLTASSTVGSSLGLGIAAGTNSSDTALLVVNQANSSTYLKVRGDGLAQAVDVGGSLQSIGWRGTPQNVQTANYTLVLSDQGKEVKLTGTTGQTVTVPANIFAAGDVVSITAFNGTNTYTVVQGTGLSLWWGGNGATSGSRTLSSVGLATVQFQDATNAVITGAGLS